MVSRSGGRRPTHLKLMLLAADIGGTKTMLRTAQLNARGELETVHEQRYLSDRYPQFEEMLQAFFSEHTQKPSIHGACLGLAGPIDGRLAKVTNLPWQLDADKIEAEFNIRQVQLINDFVAIGYGVPVLRDEDVLILQTGDLVEQAPKAIIGAGTGLGEAFLTWCDHHYHVLPTEGGHSHFAPTNPLQMALLQYLLKKYARISNERLLSGQGIVNIFEFLQYSRKSRINTELHQAMQQGDAAMAISAFAQGKKDDTAVSSLNLFSEIYGQCAGDLALSCLARGGVYLAGGIAAKNRRFLEQAGFLKAFNDKGRMTLLMTQIPVHLILNPSVGLLGALQRAYHSTQEN